MFTFLGRSVCRSVGLSVCRKKGKAVKIGILSTIRKERMMMRRGKTKMRRRGKTRRKRRSKRRRRKRIIRIKIRYKVLTMIVIFSLAPRHFPCYFVSLSHGLALTSFSSLEILFLICWYFGVFLSFNGLLFSCYEAQKYF